MENTQNQQVEQSQTFKFPNPMESKKVMVEVLVPAENNQKELLDEKLKSLQSQLDGLGKKASAIRVLWHSNDGTKTKYELEQWLINTSNCLFYNIVDVTEPLGDDYIKKLLATTKKMLKAISECKTNKVMAKKQSKSYNPTAQKTTYKDDFADFDVL